MDFPGEGYAIKHPQDTSVRSFYGHGVLQTLIRSYFSPSHTTGQRYIYTGSRCGAVHIFDIVTGEQVCPDDAPDIFFSSAGLGNEQFHPFLQVSTLGNHHIDVVRDCSWHPTQPMLVTVSWDGDIMQWGPRNEASVDQDGEPFADTAEVSEEDSSPVRGGGGSSMRVTSG